ncbi:hypothetical protein CRYUN_Cryun31cG0005900 [Craigia yunnanensis]
MALKSFIQVHPDSHFPIQNLPYGAFKPQPTAPARLAVAIGDYVLDLFEIAKSGLFNGHILTGSFLASFMEYAVVVFLLPNLKKFLALGRPAWKEARSSLQKLLSSAEPTLRDNADLRQKSLVPMSKVEMVLPMEIGDYTDFFSSMHHAKNCGTIFRGPQNPIPQNWFHLPIAYHGRASSIVISGTNIIRPSWQAAVVGPGNELGKTIDVNEAADHIFGLVLMTTGVLEIFRHGNMSLLDPFLGRVLINQGKLWAPLGENRYANDDCACAVLYLLFSDSPQVVIAGIYWFFLIIEVQIKPSGQKDLSVVARSNFKNLYWTLTQQLAHHTINGCNLRPGDLLGTGTISGPKPLSLNGTARKFLDGDEVIFTGCCKGDGYNVGFGTLRW